MIRAARMALDADLQEFSRFLQTQGIRHRINEESGAQVVWVDSEREAALVSQALQHWDFSQPASHNRQTGHGIPAVAAISRLVLRWFRESPVSLSLLLACLLVAVISELGARADRVAFLFYPRVSVDGLLPLLADLNSPGLVAQSLSPMLLHFGELHLVFNMLWLWYFGRQLEPIHPRWLFIAVIVLTSFASNTTQYLYSNYNNFGGMSGVVYGLVGYTWIVHLGMPRSRLQLNNSTFVIFVIALVVMELVASSWIASAAHVGGLVMGVLLGMLIVVYYRYLLRRDTIGP